MPIAPRQQPDGSWIWVDSATGQPAQQPGGQGTPYVVPSDQVPTAPNIDPNASRAPDVGGPVQGPASPGTGTTPPTAPNIGAPQGPQGMFTVDQATEAAAKEVQGANVERAQMWDKLTGAQKTYDDAQRAVSAGDVTQQAALNAATTQLNSVYSSLSQASQRVETANAAYSTALTNAMKLVDPNQVGLAQAQIDKAKQDGALAGAQAKVLIDGADTQKQKVAAEATQASAQAASLQASADATKAKTPAEVQQLQAQSNLYATQAKQIDTLLPGLVQKQAADTSLTTAQVGLTDSQSDYYKANALKAGAETNYTQAQADYQRSLIPGAPGLQAGQTAQAYGAGAASQASAAAALAGIQEKQLGPMYGLQQQLQAIKDIHNQFFGPGSGLNPDEATKQANDAMSDYFRAATAGTTPYAASVAAANYQQNQFGQQMSGVNALQQAMASRANQYAQLGGTALSQMAAMNQYAPRGSTAGAAAFREVMDEMSQRLASQQFAPVQIPQGPPMPALLQSFAAGHQAGYQMGTAQGQAQGQPSTVNINLGNGQTGPTAGGGFNPQASTAGMNAAGFMDNPAGRAAMAQMMGGGPTPAAPMTAGAPAPMPASLNAYATPPSVMAPPATAAPAAPAPPMVSAPIPTIPNLMQSYMGFANPMNMIGFRGA